MQVKWKYGVFLVWKSKFFHYFVLFFSHFFYIRFFPFILKLLDKLVTKNTSFSFQIYCNFLYHSQNICVFTLSSTFVFLVFVCVLCFHNFYLEIIIFFSKCWFCFKFILCVWFYMVSLMEHFPTDLRNLIKLNLGKSTFFLPWLINHINK